MGTVFSKEKSQSSNPLTFTVIHPREKLSHLGPHSGNIISCTGLFLNYARGKKQGPGEGCMAFQMSLEGILPDLNRKQATSAIITAIVCVWPTFDYLQPH